MEMRGGEDKEMEMGFDSSAQPKPTLDPLNNLRHKLPMTSRDPDRVSAVRSETEAAPPLPTARYRECQKNHAATMGGHVVDGCGEFMPCGEDGTPEALKCAACECHRNFHRKEVDGQSQYSAAAHHNYNYNPARRDTITITPPPVIPGNFQRHRLVSQGAAVMMAFGGAAESSSEDLNMIRQGNSTVGQASGSRKRFRTKFSQEQKDKMMGFADKVGWRIHKQDEQQVQQFCDDLGLKRQVFKVWMHNNKPIPNKKP